MSYNGKVRSINYLVFRYISTYLRSIFYKKKMTNCETFFELWSHQSAILYKHVLTAEAYGNSINGKPYFCKSNFMSSALKETLQKN